MLGGLKYYFVSIAFVFLLLSCHRSDNKNINLLDKADIVYHYTENKEIASLSIRFPESQKIIKKYLFIDTKMHEYKLCFDSSKDTIYIAPLMLEKRPFSETRIIPQKDLQFNLLYFDSLSFDKIELVFSKPIKERKLQLSRLQIVDEHTFNTFFKKNALFNPSELPLVNIDSETSIDTKNKKAILSIYETTDLKYKGDCRLKIRGQTSKYFAKKSFKLTLTDSLHRNYSLLGMPKEHHWILHGPYMDMSLMRNKLAFDLARSMGEYAPRSEFCELVLNNEYQGLYLLMESIKRDKHRVDIQKNKTDSITSYILKIDKGEQPIFRSHYRSKIDSGWYQYIQAVYPKSKKLNKQQIQYLKTEFNTFEGAFLESGEAYLDYIDLESFVDYFIINELTKNIDAYRLSAFLHKDTGGKIHMGPVWDFNYSFGLTQNNEGYSHKGWVYQSEAVPFWWAQLITKKQFKFLLKKRWDYLQKHQLSLEKIVDTIDQYTKMLEPAQQRNFTRWDILGQKLGVRATSVENFDEEIKNMKIWIQQRISWIDENIQSL